jgi:phenylalanyl-tRNA synthetase alpha chain
MKLPHTQAAVLETASATETRTIDMIAEETDENPTAVTRAVFELEEEDLLRVDEHAVELGALTDEGERYLNEDLPELRLYRTALTDGAADAPVSMGDIVGAADLDGKEVNIALSNFARKDYGTIESGSVSANPEKDPDSDPEADALSDIVDGKGGDHAEDVLDELERRNLMTREETTVRSVALTDDGVTALMEGVERADTVGQVTPNLLTNGEWSEVEFADYNVEADAEIVHGGRKHVLRQTADRVKSVLVGMGFEEMEGPHVDADFWINDTLFMPQDHPARTQWDRFALSHPERIDDLPEDLVERVRSAHLEGVSDDGDGYHSPWNEEFARTLALRGHTTSLSMRYLSGHTVGDLEPPQRYFSVERVYRNDTLDATHLLEFFQIEGWVMGEDLSVRNLIGTFTEFYRRFGITDIRFKPHYNPYTEPSFELFGRHPTTDELIEIGNSGLFRPEVLDPLDVDCDVMAWGLALERLAMLITGVEDIRDLHGTLADLDFLRTAEVIH